MEALWVNRCFIPPTDYQMPSWAAMADSHCVANMPDQVVQRAAHLVIITYVHYKIRAGSRHGRTQRDLSTTIRKVQVQIDQNNTNTNFSPPSCRHKGPERQGQLPSPWSLQEMTDGGCQTKTTMHGQRYFSSWANHSHAITLYITRILFNSRAR